MISSLEFIKIIDWECFILVGTKTGRSPLTFVPIVGLELNFLVWLQVCPKLHIIRLLILHLLVIWLYQFYRIKWCHVRMAWCSPWKKQLCYKLTLFLHQLHFHNFQPYQQLNEEFMGRYLKDQWNFHILNKLDSKNLPNNLLKFLS